MNLVNYPIFESPVLLFETEQGEFAGSFEGDNILVKLNNDYPNEQQLLPLFYQIDFVVTKSIDIEAFICQYKSD